jgi:DNA helicase-4
VSEREPFLNAEERRLLYVAMTRARREVLLLTVVGKESPFAIELIKDGLVDVEGESDELSTELCPRCARGLQIRRSGQYGPFTACTRFPACQFTKALG